MNTTLPIKVLDLSQWKDTLDISDPHYHYVITGTNRQCGCINFLNEDASGEKVYYVTVRNCVWEAQLWHSALGFIVRNGHGTLRAYLEVDGESSMTGSNFPGIDVNGSHVTLLAAGKGAKLNLGSYINPEGLRIINGGKVDLLPGTDAIEMKVGEETFTDFNAFLSAASQRKPVTLGLTSVPRKRIMILVNKTFENGGVVDGVNWALKGNDFMALSNIDIQYYCIQRDLDWKGISSSNSEVKYNGLIEFLKGKPVPDYIFSVSTSESTYEGQGGATDDSKAERSANGCVYVGGQYFMADCREINKGDKHYGTSKLDIGSPETENTRFYPLQKGAEKVLGELGKLTSVISEALKAQPGVPSFQSEWGNLYFCNEKNSCIGVVNVTNYEQYPIADGCAYGLFYKEMAKGVNFGTPIGIETTHGVVRMAAEKAYGGDVPPVIFVSPITDRFVRFDRDVTSTGDKQNYACSRNGGIAIAHMMKHLDGKGA